MGPESNHTAEDERRRRVRKGHFWENHTLKRVEASQTKFKKNRIGSLTRYS